MEMQKPKIAKKILKKNKVGRLDTIRVQALL